MKIIKIFLITGFLLLLMITAVFANDPIVILEDVRFEKIESAGFELISAGKFNVEAVGLRGRGSDNYLAYGWLIDSQTRKLVWRMKKRNVKRHGRHGLVKADDTVSLDAGKYELYYYVGSKWGGKIIINGKNAIRFLGDLFDGDFNDEIDDYIEDFYISVTPKKDGYKNFKIFEPDGRFPHALLQINKVGDSEYIEKGFSIDNPTEIRIYALCEYPKRNKSPVDMAWIIDESSREKVWEMDRWNTDHAGGGKKNKLVDEKISLEKGRYVLYYVSDGSHSYDNYNVLPPYDPLNWGIAILPTGETDIKAFKTFVPKGRGEALIDLTSMRDDEFESQAFELKSAQSIQIYCIGEYSGWGKEFVDYGWIENADNSRSVWEMTKRNTVHAGGASKNRKFDRMITLPKGYYIAHYITDDSHSYRDWNASQPYEPKAWGLAVYPGKDFKKSDFKLLKESELQLSADILAKLTSVRDNERRRGKFQIDKRTKIRIYAIGEGSRDEMYDYGWILNDNTGRVVWEMTWRNTEPAGGARKNRLYDDSIILDPGKYIIYFITDGSHSFNDWNSSKPRDPVNWGVTVSID